MSERRFSSSSNQATASSSGGGCLSGLLLPPLAVILIGAALAYLAFGPANPLARADTVRDDQPGNHSPGRGGGRGIAPIFTPQVQYWAKQIQAWASGSRAGPEPGGNRDADRIVRQPVRRFKRRGDGAIPGDAISFRGGGNPYDPQTNALRGLNYLKRSLQAAGGDPRLTLAGYNGGIGVIGQAEFTWSPQTQAYARRGNRYYADASAGAVSAADMQDYQSAGRVKPVPTGSHPAGHQSLILSLMGSGVRGSSGLSNGR